MALIVQKYGGTSVGSVERIQAVAQCVCQTVKAGNSVVVVVSAMGKTTDGLVKLAHEISHNPIHREMDVLLSTGEQVSIALVSMALQELGQPTISLTGAQVKIITESEPTRARILHIETERIQQQLNQDKVVVVAGFQGITNTWEWDITTLGRGGSDTSAVALAAALRADYCEIYTDVPGILTTDPRLVPEAQLIDKITCDEMLELASLGAKVLHPRAVEIARNYCVPLMIRSSWTNEPGTWVLPTKPQMRSLTNLEVARPVDYVTFDAKQLRVSLLQVPDKSGIAARVFRKIVHQNVDVDLIIQSIHEGDTNDIAFTIRTPFFKQAEAVAQTIIAAIRAYQETEADLAEVTVQQNIAKVSIAGAGMIGRPGVAAKMFASLADAGVNIQMISTSEVKVSCVIDALDCEYAVSALHKAFEVDEVGNRELRVPTEWGLGTWDLGEDMEIEKTDASFSLLTPTLSIRGIALDIDQARLAIRQVPDHLGMVAKLFSLLAQHKISVDMIIQSPRCRMIDGVPRRDIAFTVAHTDAEFVRETLAKAAAEFGWGEVILDGAIAKVSIVGAGMVRQPGVAAKMFEVLAQHQINIQMIATSEIKISCVVAQEEGIKAIRALHSAFGLAGSQKIQVPV